MNDKVVEIIVNYYSGRATIEEKKTLCNWLEKSEENKIYFDQISDIWFAAMNTGKMSEYDVLSALKTVKSKINKEKRILFFPTIRNKQTKTKSIFAWFIRIAAVLIIVFSLGTTCFYLIRNLPFNHNVDTLTTIAAPIGSKSKITLSDGTKVWLNAGSTLKYSENFNKKNRSVELVGEGYFEVMKNKALPFLVNACEMRITALGTAFNIKAYPEEGSVETTLVSGSLVVEQVKKDKKVLLAPNQRATYFRQEGHSYLSEPEDESSQGGIEGILQNADDKILHVDSVETDVITAWKDGRLIFRNEPFRSLAVELERWFDVEINISSEEISDYHFNGTIENETIMDVMEIIKYTLPVQYTIKHKLITIYGEDKKLNN
jgi:transmembrane sensor